MQTKKGLPGPPERRTVPCANWREGTNHMPNPEMSWQLTRNFHLLKAPCFFLVICSDRFPFKIKRET